MMNNGHYFTKFETPEYSYGDFEGHDEKNNEYYYSKC